MKPADHPDVPAGKIGVLLINLGTPDAPEARAVRRYLAEFLSDRASSKFTRLPGSRSCTESSCALVRRNPPRRIIRCGPTKVRRCGRSRSARREALRKRMPDVSVHYAMRYGNPGLLRRSKRHDRRRLHAHPGGAALSAILRGDDRDRQRCSLRRVGAYALAAGAANASALL